MYTLNTYSSNQIIENVRAVAESLDETEVSIVTGIEDKRSLFAPSMHIALDGYMNKSQLI